MTHLLHQRLRQATQQYPDKQAVRYQGQFLTYRQLNKQSDQLATTLWQLGVRRGDRVGIYLDKSLPAVVAIFGILKAGAVYVPLDAGSPKSRIAYIVENCAMKAFVSTVAKLTGLRAQFAEALRYVQGVIVVDELADDSAENQIAWPQLLETDISPIPNAPIENDLAYILYTSGSTGTPKGVMISHRAALTFVDWAQRTFDIKASDRLSNHAPFHFDLSVLDLFAAITVGATVVLVPVMLSVFPRNLADFIAQEQISIWYSVPSALTRLVLYGQLGGYEYPHLRTILFAGEVFPIKYLRQLMTLWPQPRYFNLFGPTETNVCTFYEVQAGEISAERTTPLSIGKACDNYETFVLGGNDVIVPAGTVGELCARGPGIMTGYWGLPERTAQSRTLFTLHPTLGAEMIYRTGDMVREEADGNYTYLGRRDNMIKSRGYRIEIGEIEAALYNHPNVLEAVVVPVPDDEIGNRLYAFVAVQNGVGQPELKAFCARQVPKYMLPHAIELRETLPKTSTGKLDRATLLEQLLQS